MAMAELEQTYPSLVIFISTGLTNVQRRASLRGSWFLYKSSPDSILTEPAKQATELLFVVARPSCAEAAATLQAERATHNDIVLLDAPEGYQHLWRKALTFLSWLTARQQPYDYVMHADDDSYVRLDLLLEYLRPCPRQRFYWGYIWDGTGNRVTAPIRNPANKSHMPVEQYAPDYYPPFASGCGFILTPDLVVALLRQPLPDYRLLDPPFGIHLCGPEGTRVLAEG
ncbi:MAG: hypothetical protein WDW38_003152 [Sanguina aurantia]